MALSVGDQIGDYEVTGALGSGGMGQVYQVRHTISQRTEAMKVLHANLPGSDEISERFLREIRVLASLDHPNIAALRTAFRHHGEMVMILEFVDGMTLRAKLSRGNILMSQSIDYMRQILSGLAYAHERGVVHRDIKPSNVMIARGDRVKLLDFGLAFQGASSQLTRTGLILGSPHYMSPEQVVGERVDARTDIYSVGVTLYQLLTGRVPIDGSGEYAIATGHLKQIPPDPISINPDIPARLSGIVKKSLAKSPADRFQTAAEFLQELNVLHSDETMTMLPAPAREAPSSGSRKAGELAASEHSSKTLSGASVLASVTRELAQYIGPIAKVVVNRAAKQAATLDDLYALTAPEIAGETERQSFMATRRKYSLQG